jgi:hypothetical protein
MSPGASQAEKAAAFRALHEGEPFLIPSGRPIATGGTGSRGASFAPLRFHAPPMEWQVLFRAAEPRTDTQQGMAAMDAALIHGASLFAISIAAGPLMVRASPSVLTSSSWLGCAKATSSRQKIGRPGTPRSPGSPLMTLNWLDLIVARPVRWT